MRKIRQSTDCGNDVFSHDTHAHSVPPEALQLLEEVAARVEVPGVLLERDDRFPQREELEAELVAIQQALDRGRVRRVA